MGTGTGFYDIERQELGRCPHCMVTVRFQVLQQRSKQLSVSIEIRKPAPFRFDNNPTEPARSFYFYRCPNCYDVVVWMATWRTCMADRSLDRVYPIRSDHGLAPDGTPRHIAKGYEEAARVLPLSPSAAAALARRSLQMILRDVFHVPHGSLKSEIEAAKDRLPSWAIEGLDNLRVLGNFALHPSKDNLTGDVVEIEPNEAELTVSLVEGLLQNQFSGHAAAVTLAAILSAKKSE